jgi:hypothetical protein
MLANDAQMRVDMTDHIRRKQGLRTIDDLDQRTKGAKRVAELIDTFGAELTKAGRALGPTEIASIRNAALLTALAEDAQARRLAGDFSVSLEDIVRTTNAARRAVKELGIKRAPTTPPPSLREYVASRSAPPADDKSHQEGLEGRGEASGEGQPG